MAKFFTVLVNTYLLPFKCKSAEQHSVIATKSHDALEKHRINEFTRFSRNKTSSFLSRNERREPQTPGNKYLYAKLANKHCLNDRGSRIFRLEEGSLAALMSSRGNRRDHSGSRLDRERSSPTTRMKEGHTESRERGMEKKSRTGGARTDLLRYLRLVSRLFREEC